METVILERLQRQTAAVGRNVFQHDVVIQRLEVMGGTLSLRTLESRQCQLATVGARASVTKWDTG